MNETRRLVINRCFGGFWLSPKAQKRLAELQGKECYFFRHELGTHRYNPVSMDEIEGLMTWSAFTIPNPNDVLWPSPEMGDRDAVKAYNARYNEVAVPYRFEDADRGNPQLIQVVEELGAEAGGALSKLVIVEIPADVEWEIDDYDGMETVREAHRSWS